jgi:hypothetical protein
VFRWKFRGERHDPQLVLYVLQVKQLVLQARHSLPVEYKPVGHVLTHALRWIKKGDWHVRQLKEELPLHVKHVVVQV